MAKEKPEKILEKWKTHYFWKPQIAETYYKPRKKKNTKYKERNKEKKEKCRPHRKNLRCGRQSTIKKTTKHVISRHVISRVVIIYRSCYVITYSHVMIYDYIRSYYLPVIIYYIYVTLYGGSCIFVSCQMSWFGYIHTTPTSITIILPRTDRGNGSGIHAQQKLLVAAGLFHKTTNHVHGTPHTPCPLQPKSVIRTYCILNFQESRCRLPFLWAIAGIGFNTNNFWQHKKEENLQGSPLFYAVKYFINTSLSCRQRCKPDP